MACRTNQERKFWEATAVSRPEIAQSFGQDNPADGAQAVRQYLQKTANWYENRGSNRQGAGLVGDNARESAKQLLAVMYSQNPEIATRHSRFAGWDAGSLTPAQLNEAIDERLNEMQPSTIAAYAELAKKPPVRRLLFDDRLARLRQRVKEPEVGAAYASFVSDAMAVSPELVLNRLSALAQQYQRDPQEQKHFQENFLNELDAGSLPLPAQARDGYRQLLGQGRDAAALYAMAKLPGRVQSERISDEARFYATLPKGAQGETLLAEEHCRVYPARKLAPLPGYGHMQASLRLPEKSTLMRASAVGQGKVRTPAQAVISEPSGQRYMVQAELELVSRDGQIGMASPVRASKFSCTCLAFRTRRDCVHADALELAVLDELNPPEAAKKLAGLEYNWQPLMATLAGKNTNLPAVVPARPPAPSVRKANSA